MAINYARIFLAALGGTFVYYIYGFIVFGVLIKSAYRASEALYRPASEVTRYMLAGIVATYVGLLALGLLYVKCYTGGSGWTEGWRVGLLTAVLITCVGVVHNWVTMRMDGKLAALQAVATFLQWILVGMTIGLLYRPHHL